MDSRSVFTGRAKTALVLGDGGAEKAVISAVVARPQSSQGDERIRFIGDASFEPGTVNHVSQVLLPIVDRVVAALGLPPTGFEISLTTIGAASSMDLSIKVAGFSADVPVLLALLAASLQMPVPEDVVTTGHVASGAGDVTIVRAIPAKLAAAVADEATRRFIYPSLTKDGSLAVLTPSEGRRIEQAILEARDHIATAPVADVAELVQAVFDDETIVLASLRRGFYSVSRATGSVSDAVDRAAQFLAEGNEARFWSVLERHLIAGLNGRSKELLEAWATFHLGTRTYPCGFGGKLLQLVRSLPPAVRRLKTLFPLLSMKHCIALSQFAAEADHEDVRLLHDAAFGQRLGPCPVKRTENDGAAADAGEDVRAALDALSTEIDPLHLAKTIGSPIDTARAGYTLDTATVESYDEFRDITAAFHLHVLRHTGTIGTPVHPGATADDAHALLDRAFARQGGFDGALAEACDGTRGGMRLILDAMTDQYKFEQQAKHINAVMRAALDPRDWDEKVAFMKALLERLAPHLPPDVRSEPAERFARHPEIVVQAYAKSIERLTALLRAI